MIVAALRQAVPAGPLQRLSCGLAGDSTSADARPEERAGRSLVLLPHTALSDRSIDQRSRSPWRLRFSLAM